MAGVTGGHTRKTGSSDGYRERNHLTAGLVRRVPLDALEELRKQECSGDKHEGLAESADEKEERGAVSQKTLSGQQRRGVCKM